MCNPIGEILYSANGVSNITETYNIVLRLIKPNRSLNLSSIRLSMYRIVPSFIEGIADYVKIKRGAI